MAGRAGEKPRTVLEQVLWQRDQTYEEVAREFMARAEKAGERATITDRHLRRLASGEHLTCTPSTRRVLEAMTGMPVSELLRPPPGPSAQLALTATPREACGDQAVRGAAQGAAAAGESLEIAAWAEQRITSVTEHVSYELSRIASCYVHAAAGPLFTDLLQLRDITFGTLRRGLPPRQAREMCLLAGITCVLLAHATENLGDAVSAMTQARAASALAEQSDHDELRAWVKGTTALIAEWTGSPAYAADLARQGQQYRQPAESLVRLMAIEARARARAGDARSALDALDRARRARDAGRRPAGVVLDYGGLLTFPLAKQRYYEGGSLVLAGRNGTGEAAALDAISRYETGPADERSYGDEAIARVDVVAARVARGELDGARAAARPLLKLPVEQRIEQLTGSLTRVCRQLSLPRFAGSQAAGELTAQIRDLIALPARAA